MALQHQQPMALAGLKVLDLSRILAGPYATQLFADLGADVVKVENPDGGDDTRRWGPPFTSKADGGRGDAAYSCAADRHAALGQRPDGAALSGIPAVHHPLLCGTAGHRL